jgi:hypothetical protein
MIRKTDSDGVTILNLAEGLGQGIHGGGGWGPGRYHSWKGDLAQRLAWLYGDVTEHMTSPEWIADLTSWRELGR